MELNTASAPAAVAPSGKRKDRSDRTDRPTGKKIAVISEANPDAPIPEKPDFRLTESVEDFKIRALNIAINAGDCYKDLTPGFILNMGRVVETDSENQGGGAGKSKGKTRNAKSKRKSGKQITPKAKHTQVKITEEKTRFALTPTQKKNIFDTLLVTMFDMNQELAMKTLTKYPFSLEKDALKRKIITFFYKNGFDVPPINDTNNVTISIKNYIEENYFQCPSGRKFKYNLHMSEDDRTKIPSFADNKINIIYDAAGMLPHNIFLPDTYKIVYTPGTYIDPGVKITNLIEQPNILNIEGIIPNRLQQKNYNIDNKILEKYGLNDIIHNISINYKPKQDGSAADAIDFDFTINTWEKGSIKQIDFNPTVIQSRFSISDITNTFTFQTFSNKKYQRDQTKLSAIAEGFRKWVYAPPSISIENHAKEYFNGNATKNKFIYDNYSNFINDKPATFYKYSNEFIKFLIMKELGDTMQVMWLDVITDDPEIKGANNKPITKENTFVMTGDSMLIARCILNGYNCIHLQGASTIFYLSNVDMETLPLMSEKLPELKPHHDEKKTAAILEIINPKYQEPEIERNKIIGNIMENVNIDERLNFYLTNNINVINKVIKKGNDIEKTVEGQNLCYYIAACLIHHTQIIYNKLRVIVGITDEIINQFKFKELFDESSLANGFYKFLDINYLEEDTPIVDPFAPTLCYTNDWNFVFYNKLTNRYLTGEFTYEEDTIFNTVFPYDIPNDPISQRPINSTDLKNKVKDYIKYYQSLPYPKEFNGELTGKNKIGFISGLDVGFSLLYKITEEEIKEIKNVDYFLEKMGTQDTTLIDHILIPNKVPVTPETYKYCVTKIVKLATKAEPATKAKPKYRGGGLEYTEGLADYEYETYKLYFKNPGYATFYALTRFPRVFLMGYSILRFIRKVFHITTPTITELFTFCKDMLEPDISRLLTNIFSNLNEINYYYNVNTDEEFAARLKRLRIMDDQMYSTIRMLQGLSSMTGIFTTNNERLLETVGTMLKEQVPVMVGSAVTPELEKLLKANSELFTERASRFFQLLIQHYNELADAGRADMVNSISCYENKINNRILTHVPEIMAPIEVMKEQALQANVVRMASVNSDVKNTVETVEPALEKIVPKVTKLSPIMETSESPSRSVEEVVATPSLVEEVVAPKHKELAENWSKTFSANPILSKKIRSASRRWINQRVQELSHQASQMTEENVVKASKTPGFQGLLRNIFFSRKKPAVTSRRTQAPLSTLVEEQSYSEEEPVWSGKIPAMGLAGGAGRKTKKRTPLKHKRTRRKERK